MFSLTVRPGKTRLPSGTCEMPSAARPFTAELVVDLVRRGVLATADGSHLTFSHPAARSYVLSWE